MRAGAGLSGLFPHSPASNPLAGNALQGFYGVTRKTEINRDIPNAKTGFSDFTVSGNGRRTARFGAPASGTAQLSAKR
jgi:hypothetical protein